MNLHFSGNPLTLSQAIQLTAAYADIFDFPLTVNEIHRYLIQFPASVEEVSDEVQRSNALSRVGEYYMLLGRESLAEVRLGREAFSAQMWVQAKKYGSAIARLPLIRMVAVTGSLAMNNTDPVQGADVDYLIVTAPGRLWSARALLLLFVRRAALAGVSLCPNYLITTRALIFPDHNLYTAHEVAQMVPLSGFDYYGAIRRKNAWVYRYLPNAEGYPWLPDGNKKPSAESPFRPLIEMLFRTPPGAWVERSEMKRKVRKLTRQQSDSPESFFSADVCKGHANRHAGKSKSAFIERTQQLWVEVEV